LTAIRHPQLPLLWLDTEDSEPLISAEAATRKPGY
jgi:hypothetical protein